MGIVSLEECDKEDMDLSGGVQRVQDVVRHREALVTSMHPRMTPSWAWGGWQKHGAKAGAITSRGQGVI